MCRVSSKLGFTSMRHCYRFNVVFKKGVRLAMAHFFNHGATFGSVSRGEVGLLRGW